MGNLEIIHCEMQRHLLKIIINKRQSTKDNQQKTINKRQSTKDNQQKTINKRQSTRGCEKITSNQYRNDFENSGTGRKAGIL